MYYGDAIAIYKLATVYYSFSKVSPEQMMFAIANLKLNMLNLFVIGAFRHPFLALVPLMRILWFQSCHFFITFDLFALLQLPSHQSILAGRRQAI